MKLTNRVSGIHPSLTLAISAKAQEMKKKGADVVSFGVGEPDFITPEYIRTAAKQAIDLGYTKYTPASGLNELKRVVCAKLYSDNKLNYSEKNIVVSSGAKHSLCNVLLALCEEGDEVIIPAPYWLTYPELVEFCGATPVFVQTKAENGFKITAEELKAAITPKTKAFIFNNPNNPSGAVYREDEIRSLAKVLDETDIAIIADEIYEKLSYETECYSIARYSEKLKNNTITLNGVSKTYAMTGWRIGFIACEENLAKAISSMQSQMTSNPCSIAQYAAIAAYAGRGGNEFVASLRGSFDKRRKLICAELDKICAKYVRPDGAFYVIVDVSSSFGKSVGGKQINTALGFAENLLESKAVAVVPCEPFGAPEYVRLSYAVSETDIVKGITRMGEFISEIK